MPDRSPPHARSTSTQSTIDAATTAFRRFRDGDNSSVDTLLIMLNPILWHTVRAEGLDPHTAEDVIATTWLRFLEHQETIQQPRTLLAWLITTARREAWRTLRATNRTTLAGGTSEEIHDLPRMDTTLSATPQDPSLLVELTESQQTLWRHVSALSPKCQALLRVIAAGGKPDYRELADTLDMAMGSIGPTRNRCLSTLRKSLTTDSRWSRI